MVVGTIGFQSAFSAYYYACSWDYNYQWKVSILTKNEMMYSSVADSAAVPYNGYIAIKWCLSCDLYLEINKSIGSWLFFSYYIV